MVDTQAHSQAAAKKRKPAWVKILRASIGLAILAILFYVIPIGGVIEVMSQASWWPLLGATAIVFAMQWVTADRLRRLCSAHGHDWSTFGVMQINLSTRFYGLFLPGGNFTGIAIRFYKLAGEHKHYLGTAVALFYDRVAATVTLCGVGAVFWLLERPNDSWQSLAAILVAMAVMILGLLVLFSSSPGPFIAWIRRMLSRIAGVKMHTLRQAVRESRSLSTRQTTIIYLLSIIPHLLGTVSWYLLCQSLGIEVSLITIGWIRSAVILATMIPISVSGLGLREGASVLLLTSYGVGQESALAFSILVFFITTVLIGLAGGATEAWRLLAQQE